MSEASWPVGLKKLIDEAWAYFFVVGGGFTAVGLGYIPVTSAAETRPWLGLATAAGGILILCGVVGGLYQLKSWLATKAEEQRRVHAEQAGRPKRPDPQELANGMVVLIAKLSPEALMLLSRVNLSHVYRASPNDPVTRELLRCDLIEPTRGNEIQELHSMLNEQTPYRLTDSGLEAVKVIKNA